MPAVYARAAADANPRSVPSVAGDAIVAALLDVEVEMVAVVVIVTGAEHGVEVLAAVATHIVQEAALAEREEARLLHVDILAVVQLDAHDIKRVALAMLGQRAAAGDLAAGIARSLMDGLDPGEIAPAGRRHE